MGNEDADTLIPLNTTRIAVYDDLRSEPRIIDIQPKDIVEYIEEIASTTYELAQAKGSSIPYTIIKEVCENFIHAGFKEPCISILDSGNTIRFTDQGPGIEDKERAQLPGFTTATSEMRKYIRGVGSGLPIVKEYLSFSNGKLTIEDNMRAGTVVTIKMEPESAYITPVVYREHPRNESEIIQKPQATLKKREYDILLLANDLASVGPTEVHDKLGMSMSTAYRELSKLEEMGYLKTGENRKRSLTEEGLELLGEEV